MRGFKILKNTVHNNYTQQSALEFLIHNYYTTGNDNMINYLTINTI